MSAYQYYFDVTATRKLVNSKFATAAGKRNVQANRIS